ncbi:MAG: DUF5990 family protein [Sphingomonas sp.]
MRAETFELRLRVVMEHPPAGAVIALQRGASGKAELIGPVSASPEAFVFDFAVTVSGAGPDGGPRFLGACVQGPLGGRFVYLNSGRYAGVPGATGGRRAKVPLGGISWALIEAVPAGERLTAHIAATARDGGVACASVPLLPPGWRAG